MTSGTRPSPPPGAPRLPPGVIERPRLLDVLDGEHPLVVVRSPGGTGKTTLLAQWSARHPGIVVWVTPDDSTYTRSGYWMRVLTQLHLAGAVDSATLERELTSLATDASIAPDVLHRVLGARTSEITLVLDNVGSLSPDTFWASVCDDVAEAVRRIPTLRCIVSGRFPTPLEAARARATVALQVIETDAMLLTPAEIDEVLDQHGQFLDDAGRQRLRELDSSSQAMSLRYTLEMLTRSPERARDLGRPGTELPHLDIARQELLGRVQDEPMLEFLGATALSPAVDVALAQQLTGRADAQQLLDRLEASGAGQWTRAEDGTAVFRYGEYVRAVAADEYGTRHAQRLPRQHGTIARWLFEERDEKLAALEHAVQAKDLEFASHVLLRAYPLSDEDRAHVGTLLDDLPAHQIHRHPLLALRYALILNARESTQARALEYFISSSAMSRLRASSSPGGERAIHLGIESAVWRLLGQDKRMAKRADEAVTAMEHALRAEDRDDALEWASLQSLHHAGISLLYAGSYARARDAFSLLEEVARRRRRAGFENAACCGLAMIEVLQGDFGRASAHLDRIDPAAWPKPWATGYMAALGYIAQAWVHVNAGRSEAALEALDTLAPHAATIEHWDLMLGARVLAQALEGRVHDAQLVLETVRTARVNGRTFASTHARLALIDALLNLASGTPRPLPKTLMKSALAPLGHAIEAMVADRRGETADVHAHLTAAESTAATALARGFAHVAGALASTRDGSALPAERYAGRLRALVAEHDLRWPLALLPPATREALISSDPDPEGRPGLGAAFDAIAPLVDERDLDAVAATRLTPRELEILRAMVFIDSRHELAAHLYVSINTVKSQLRSLYAKLGVSTREEALEKALAYGLIDRAEHPEA